MRSHSYSVLHNAAYFPLLFAFLHSGLSAAPSPIITSNAMRVRRFVSRHPLFTFVFLAYAWAWLFWIPGVIRHRSDLALTVGAYGPLFAAVGVTMLTEGGQGVRVLLRKLFVWRVSIWWYAAAVFVPYLSTVVLLPIYVLRGGSLGPFDVSGFSRLPLLIAMVIPNGPLGEELGWRGFLLPRLTRRTSLLNASLLIGPIWTFWHAPLFYAPFGSLISGAPVTLTSVGMFLMLVTGLSVLIAWVWHHSGGSVLLSFLMHASVNINALTLFLPGVARVQSEYFYMSMGILWIVILAIVVIDRRSFTATPKKVC